MTNSQSFESLSFHDCKIYAVGFNEANYKLLFDIDYIYNWITDTDKYKFQLFPATLIFENVWGIEFDISMNNNLIIDSIIRTSPRLARNSAYLEPNSKTEYDWVINTLQGEISFKATRIKLYERSQLVHKENQELSFEERGNICLDEKGKEIIIT